MGQVVALIVLMVVGVPLLVWALDREAKANARRAALARFAASPEYAALTRRLEGLGRQLQRMAVELNEIDWSRIRRALADYDTTSTGAPR